MAVAKRLTSAIRSCGGGRRRPRLMGLGPEAAEGRAAKLTVDEARRLIFYLRRGSLIALASTFDTFGQDLSNFSQPFDFRHSVRVAFF